MPTVLRSGPYRFFFYAGDRDEAPHVHVEREDNEAKVWLDPVIFRQVIIPYLVRKLGVEGGG